jgi:hypothetical protein
VFDDGVTDRDPLVDTAPMPPFKDADDAFVDDQVSTDDPP